MTATSNRVIHCVSLSTGKDSSATACLALATQPRASLRFAACDTGNEHEEFPRYLAYMERHLGIEIAVLRASFDEEIAGKAEYVRTIYPTKLIREGMSERQAISVIERCLRALHPTGNPFLDLCLWKGRFPSRTKQFCTQELKTKPLVSHQLGFIERGEAEAVWAWQGVRIDESEARRSRLACSVNVAFSRFFDELGGGIYNYRPILRWTAKDAFEAMAMHGLKPNPLYLQGMSRVGCMPCINASKDEVLEISKRFPGHIDRIEYWEREVASASKREEASFFPDPERDAHLNRRGIRNVVEWAKTKRGGKMLDWIRMYEEPQACASAYGLCE